MEFARIGHTAGSRSDYRAAKCWTVAALVSLSLLALVTSGAHGESYTFTAINYPGATATTVQGIDGSNLVGTYVAAGVTHGFQYNNGIYTTIDVPGASSTSPSCINGNAIVGWYQDGSGAHGYISRNGVVQTLNYPGAYSTWGGGVSGAIVDGNFNGPTGTHGFTYDGTTFTQIPDAPGAIPGASGVYGISGSTLVGNYEDFTGHHGFTYNNGVFSTPLDDPDAPAGTTWALGVSGNTVIGAMNTTDIFVSQLSDGTHGFVLNNGVYMTVDYPGSTATLISNISNSTIVGYYTDAAGTHGFVGVAAPEPGSLALLGVGIAGLLRRRRT